MLDAAYQLAKKAHTSSSHAEAKDKLQSMFPDAPWNEIVDAYLKGSELAEKCYEIGDIARREGIPHDRAIEMLKHDSLALVIRSTMTFSHLAGFFLDDARVFGYDLIHGAVVIEPLVAVRN